MSTQTSGIIRAANGCASGVRIELLELFTRRSSMETIVGLSSLPFDVMAHLLGFVPFVPRLRVFSLLSKRWRAAFLHSVTGRDLVDASNYEAVRYFSFLRSTL